MLEAIVTKVNIRSYKNRDAVMCINIPRHNYPILSTVCKEIETVFSDEIENGRLSVEKEKDASTTIIKLKGILIWDNIPVINLALSFDDGVLTLITGEFFSIGTTASALWVRPQEIFPIISDCPSSHREVYLDQENETFSIYVHYLNAQKLFAKGKGKEILISLVIHPDYLDNMFNSTGEAVSAGRIGLPVYLKDSTSYWASELSCHCSDMFWLESISPSCSNYKYDAPAYIKIEDDIFRVTELKLYSSPENSNTWEKILVRLDADKETFNRLKQKGNVPIDLSYFALDRASFTNDQMVYLNPDNNYDLAVRLSEDARSFYYH